MRARTWSCRIAADISHAETREPLVVARFIPLPLTSLLHLIPIVYVPFTPRLVCLCFVGEQRRDIVLAATVPSSPSTPVSSSLLSSSSLSSAPAAPPTRPWNSRLHNYHIPPYFLRRCHAAPYILTSIFPILSCAMRYTVRQPFAGVSNRVSECRRHELSSASLKHVQHVTFSSRNFVTNALRVYFRN